MSSSYSVEFAPSGGLHPSLTIAYSAPHSSCPLYLHLSLPPAFIPDRFQLAQLHTEGRLGSHAFDPAALSLEVTGSRDLEGPSSRAVGAQVLLRLRAGREELVNVKGKGREVVLDTVDLPLHLRYQPPVRKRWNQKGERLDIVPVELAWPTVFWACQEDQNPPEPIPCHPTSIIPSLSSSPFNTLHFLSPNSTHPSTISPPPLTLPVPTGVIADLPLIELINCVTIWFGMIWIAWEAFKACKNCDCKRSGKKKKRE